MYVHRNNCSEKLEKNNRNNLANMKYKDFAGLNNYIVNNRNELNSGSAINILINCCNICLDSSDKAGSPKHHLKNILNISYNLISTLNEKQMLSYTQAIYHIVKYLTEKELYDIIFESGDIIWPTFLPSPLPSKIINIYRNMCKLLSNVIANYATETHLSYSKTLLRISEVARNISSKISDPLEYLTLSLHSFINLTKLKIPPEHQKDHYIYILKKIEGKEIKKNILAFYQPLLTFSALIIHNTLKTMNFEMALNFFQEIEDFSVVIFGRHTCMKNLFELLKLPLILSPLESGKFEQLLKYNRTIKDFITSEVKQHSQEVGNKLGMILVTVMNFYKTQGQKIWAQFAEDLQLEILRCVYNVSELESQTSIKCSCGCFVKHNSYQSFTACQVIMSFLNISISQCPRLKSSYHEQTLLLFTKFVEKIIYLRDNKCKNWKIAWFTLGSGIYNLALQLYKKTNINALHYFYFYIQYCVSFEENNEEIVKSSVLSSAIQAVCSLCSKNYRKSLGFSALGTFLCVKQRETFMTIWIKTKHDLKGQNDEIQTITLVQAFKIFSKELEIGIDFDKMLKEEDEINLLTFELEQYKRKWKSKIPMMATLKELANRTNNAEKTCEVIGRIFGDSDLLFHEIVLEVASNILEKVEEESLKSKKKSNSNFYLSILYFLNYKRYMKNVIQKHIEEMDRNSKVVPIKATTEIHKNPNEECDIISTYENLKLDIYLSNLKYLESSLSLIEQHSSEIIKDGDIFGFYNILMKIAFEYRLMDHRTESIRALNLALQIAQSENIPLNIMQSVSFIVESSDIMKQCIKELITTADRLLAEMSYDGSTKKIILMYYICKAKAFLYKDADESYKNFTMACNLLNSDDSGDNFETIRNQLLFLKFKYLSMPCDAVTELHKENLFDIFSSVSCFFEESTRSSNRAYEISTLLETNEGIINFYHCIKCPREVRYYCKELVVVAQKLMLPLRCSTYLVYLGQADLYSNRLDDCRVKLNGVADILGFNKYKTPTCENSELKYDFELQRITREMDEIDLDLPTNNPKIEVSPSSPVFPRQTADLPSFIEHEKSCDCFCCTCFEYQDLVLKKILLEAMMKVKLNDFTIARKLFYSGLNLYQAYSQKYELYNDVNNTRIPQDLLCIETTKHIKSYGCLLLGFGKFLINVDKKSSAKIVNEKLVKLLEPFKHKYLYLYHDVLLQRLSLLTDTPRTEFSNFSPVKNTDVIMKTPEDNFNKVSVTVQRLSPCSPIIKIPMKKRLEFETSPESKDSKKILSVNERESATSRKEPFPSRNVAATCKKDLSLARKEHLKTPAPKIKIYSEDEDKGKVSYKRVTRTKTVSEKIAMLMKKNDSKSPDLSKTRAEVTNGKRQLTSRKNLLGELNVQTEKTKK